MNRPHTFSLLAEHRLLQKHLVPLLYSNFNPIVLIHFIESGELSKEEDVLEWLVANKSTGDEEDVIEDVTAKTLNTLIGNIDNLVVLFCKNLAIMT